MLNAPLFMGRYREFIPYTSSTNQYALEKLKEIPLPLEGSLYFTEDQQAGRGQAGNNWFSVPNGSFTGSYVLYPHFLPSNELHRITQVAALAVSKSLEQYKPEGNIQIKWPNDIVVKGRKICGILTENRWLGDRFVGMVCGIGVNLNIDSFPEAIAPTAVSLHTLIGKKTEATDFIETLSLHLEQGYLKLKSAHFSEIESDYLSKLYRYKEWGLYDRGKGPEKARIEGVDSAGRLQLLFETGLTEVFNLKEIRFI
jgi:BirA family biotin operon repressor/biotin-[acetyl-CoA-carboxylase] ligase